MGNEHEPDTEGLAGKALADDPQAFADLVQRLRGRLEMWISLRMGPLLRSRLTEEDVFQETLLQAHRSLDQFKDQGPDSFRRWMFSVAENRLKDLHKYHAAQKRDPAREAPAARTDTEREFLKTIPTGGTSPSYGADRNDAVARLLARIQDLDEPLRDVVVLRAIEERTFPEVAAAVGKTLAVVKGLYARALTRLAEEMQA